MSKIVKFMDLEIGSKFIHEDNQYYKIKDKRLTCCKVLNAALVDNPKKDIMIIPVTEVEVIDSND